MNRRLFAGATLACLLTTLPILADNPHTVGGAYTVPVTGTVNGSAANGTFVIKQFANINNHLNALGTLTINNVVTSVAIPVALNNPTTALSAANAVYGNSNQSVTSSAAAAAACPVLHLVLGPLTLNLLGLNISLNQVVLDITAIPGAGNLLGNLLCDVANLLNPGGLGALNQLVAALNNLLAAL